MVEWLKGFFVLASVQELRPDPASGEGRYVRSFLTMRLIIGFLGLLLPLALVFIDRFAFHGYPYPRGSMSIYYYSGMREVFTVSIGTIAFFLFAYKLTERNLDNTLSFGAGLAGMLIPLCPTARPSLHPAGFAHPTNPVPPALTPLQKLLGEHGTQVVHMVASGVFITLLAVTAVTFGIREGQRRIRNDRPHFGPRFWRLYHWGCALVIVAAEVWILFAVVLFHGPYWSLLAGEGFSAAAFGASWLAKGAEWRYLFGRSSSSGAL